MKRFLALLLALSLCFGMLPMPGSAEAAEETQEAVLEEDIPDEAVEAAEPEPSEEAAGETLEETFAAEEALPESGPVLVITEQPEDTLTVEGVAYFAVSAQVEQDGRVLEEAEVSCQWQHLDGDTWVTLEGETGEILAVEGPEVGDTYRCLVTWEDLEAVSEAAAVLGEEEPLDYTSAVWINPAYRDLYSEEDFSDSFEISTNASAISCSSREAALAAIREAMVKREPVITLELNYSYGSLDDEVEALTAHMYDHNGDPKQGDYLGYAVGGYGYGWGGRQFFLQDIKYYTTAAQELQADAAVKQILASLNLDGKTDLQKINAIYNWLVRNVKYVSDAELADQTNLAKYAGYAALVQKKAVCQGYAGAFYRLCMEAGVDSRIISCQAMNHAWNIVRVGDWYYHLDATWDAYTPDSWRYYLKGTVNWLKDHQSSTTNYISELGDQFQDSGFASDYPVPEEDYNSLALSPDGTLTLHADDPAWRQSYSTQVLNGKTVTTAPWGKKADEIRKVVIEEGVTGISNNAFYGCSNLESVTFPSSLRTVGRNAFDGCGLTSVTLGANVELVESYAFQNNPGLTSVTFEGTSTQVQNFSFEKSPVENLTLPAGLKLTFGALGSQSSVQSLKHLTLTGSGPMADYTSSQSAAWGYSGLETVTFAPGITTVGAYAFVNCVQLKSHIVLPSALTKIGEGAFDFSYYIPGFTFTGSQVPEIEDTAFDSIRNLSCIYPCAWAAAPNSSFGARTITWQQAAHSLTHHEAQAPAAGKDGWLEYWQCDVCGRYYLTESAEAPVAWENIRQEALPAEKGCQIAFDGNTTEELLGSMTPIQAPRDADVTLPECNFTVFGYTFTGWNTQADGKGKAYQPGDTVRNLAEEGTVTLYAQWKASTYRLVFLPGAEEGTFTGSVAPMEDLENGKQYPLPKNRYTRPGYIFTGWMLDGTTYAEGERYTVHGEEAETLEFVACWDPITYTVRFNANKGTGKMEDQKGIAFDTPAELRSNTFTRKGYRFVGWNTKANGTGEDIEEAYQLTTTNKATVTLYAMWEANTYTVVFHGPDGAEETQTVTYDRNEALAPNPFEKAGYTFAKWNTQENGKGKAYTNNAKVKNLSTGDEEVDLFAQWTPNQYTVEFHSNLAKDTVKKQTLTYDGKETVLTANSFAWKGHAFLGWALTADGEVEYLDKQPVQNLTTGKTVALYAQWKVNEYTVVFDGNGAEGEDVEQLMTYDEAAYLKENTFTRPGYDFSGWATTAKGKAVHVDQKTVKNLTDKNGAVVRLYAVWTPYTYTVTFAPGADAVTGKTADMKKLVNGKQYAPKSCGFKRPGYVFDGWMLPDGKVITTKEKFSNLGETKDAVVTLTATWKPITYKIRFNANKGTGKVEDETGIVYDVPRQLSGKAFFRKGYTFTGWNTKANGTGTSYDRDATVEKLTTVNNGTVTLYAQWEANSYKVYFNANGGEGEMDPITMVYDKAVKLPKNTFRSNATFMGWSTSWNGKVIYKDAASVKNLSDESSVMLFAVWKYPAKDNGNLQKVDYPASGNALYDEILEKNITEVLYRDELGYERRQEEKLSNIYNEYGILPNNMKYTYRDLDQDGVSELIIFEGAEGAWDSVVYAIYSTKDNQLLFPVNGWARNRYYICPDKEIVYWGSGGAAYTLYAKYSYEDYNINLEECYFTTDQRGDNYWFYSKVKPYDANAEPISKEVFDERTLELMSNCIKPEGRTFLDYLRQDEAAVRYEISAAKQTEDALNRQLQGKNLLQAEKDSIAQEKFELWDNALNQLLRILKYRLPREDAKKLTAEQNEWITQRTAAGQKASQGKGDAAAFYNFGAQADFTRNRTLNLLAKLGN